MAISPSLLANGNGGNSAAATTHQTASMTFTAGRLYTISFGGSGGFNNTATSVVGDTSSDAWTELKEQIVSASNGCAAAYHYVPASTHSETLTITLSGSTGLRWATIEWTGTVTTGTNGADAFGTPGSQAVSTATPAVTLGAFADATNNVAFGMFYLRSVSGTWTVDDTPAGYAELYDNGGDEGRLALEWKTGQDTAVGGTWSAASNTASIAVEIKMAAPAATSIMTQLTQHYRQLRT